MSKLWLLLAAPLLFGLAPHAGADDCDPGCARAPVTCNGAGTCHVRDACHPSTRYTIPRTNCGVRGSAVARGCRPAYGPWAEMRSGLYDGRTAIRLRYVRNYFLRRFPFAVTEGAAIEEVANVDALLVVGDPEQSERPLDTAGRLDRGTARVHVGAYNEARADFEAVLADTPADARARLGLVLCATVRADWTTASRELDTLAEAGELQAEDRFDPESIFADPAKLKSMSDGLVSTAGYRPSSARAHVVTAWLLAGRGDEAGARRFARMARRAGSPTPALEVLEQNLGLAERPAAAPSTPERDVRAPDEAELRPIARVVLQR
ncbi:MAG: hypothetical protein O2894_01400 [Planctomycetota bacterium]|nr:hypothetical protein [Planctomycetota bacterium]